MDVVQHAEHWLDAYPKGPHFVWVHLYDPHDPYEPPPPYSQTYRGHLYDGEIAYADAALAQFLGYLDRRGWYRPALIVVVGDHGEGLGEHHEDTHGIFLYDSTTHVPLIFKLPAGAAATKSARGKATPVPAMPTLRARTDQVTGKVIDAQVRTTDILPTVLDLVSTRIPRGLDGDSLKPALNGAATTSRPAFGETDYPLRFGWAPLRSLRFDHLKFIEAPRPEFYNLKSDPGEVNNIYEPWNANVQKFRSEMAEVRSQEKTAAAPAAGAVPTSTIAELKALGYLGPEGATNVPEPSLLPDPKDKIEEQNLLHTAMLASDDGRTGEARNALEQVLARDPDSAIALRQLGELEYSAGEYEKAANHLKRARALSPRDSFVAFLQGKVLAAFGDFPAAREALETSLHVVPGQFEARRLLAEVDMKLGDAKAAADQLEAALLLQPDNTDAQADLARAFLADHNFSEAAQQLEDLAKSQPNNAEVYSLLAQAYEGLGKKELAQRSAARAEQLRTSNKARPQ